MKNQLRLKKLLFCTMLSISMATYAIDYASITYDWVDWQGVTHTSNLTEKATSPEQIIALVEKIYTDPHIPGTKRANTDAEPSPTVDEMYNNQAEIGFDFGGDVTPPYEEGLTMLLVKVNDKWSITNIYAGSTSGEEYHPYNVHYYERNHCDAQYTGKSNLYMFISEAIESIQLVTSCVRIEESDPTKCGYVVNVRESLNKFFFISKGKQRELGANSQLTYPFGWMFEEFSPTLNTGQEVQTNNVFDYISNGESYSITHICGSVLWQDHQFILDKENNSAHEVNMSFFIPDYRLKYWTASDVSEEQNIANAPGRWWENGDASIHTDNTYYHPDYFPKLFVYTVNIQKNSVTNHINTGDETGSYSDVNISWDVNIDDIVGGATVDQIFNIYKVVDGVIQSEPIATVRGDNRSYTIVEERGEESSEVKYIVSAQPMGTIDYAPIWSNEITVTIPGTINDYHLNLSIQGNGSCVFDEENQINYYANPIVMTNGIAENTITWNNTNDTFTNPQGSYYYASRICFYRINKKTGERTRIATMNLRRLSPTNPNYETFNKDYIMYGVPIYENQVTHPDTEAAYPQVQNISGQGGVNNIPGNVLPIVNGKVDFCNFPLLDCFATSVTDNTHPSDYQYQAVYLQYPTSETQGTTSDDTDAEASNMRSNLITVNVPHTTSHSSHNVHTADFISADDATTDLSQLTALNNGIRVKFSVVNNPRIVRYVVTRTNDNTIVAIAQRVDDGSYTVYQRDKNGYLNVSAGNYAFDNGVGEMTISGFDDLRDTEEDIENITYRVTIECKNIITNYGTTLTSVYGSPIISPRYITFELIQDQEQDLLEFVEGVHSVYQVNKYGLTNVNFDNYAIDHYNIWRTLPDGTAELILSSTTTQDEYWKFEPEYIGYEIASDACFYHADPVYIPIDATDYFINYKARVYLRPIDAQARTTDSEYFIAEDVINSQFYYSPTNVEENIADDTFNVYPTIVDNTLNIIARGHIEIYSISGALVRTIDDALNSRTIDVSKLPAGYYIVKNGTEVKQFIIK